jgi:hypothetical protein
MFENRIEVRDERERFEGDENDLILVDETDADVLAMFTKTLAIIDCISTLISLRPEYYDRFNGIILRIIYLLPG